VRACSLLPVQRGLRALIFINQTRIDAVSWRNAILLCGADMYVSCFGIRYRGARCLVGKDARFHLINFVLNSSEFINPSGGIT
jgi:hypothetical protein